MGSGFPNSSEPRRFFRPNTISSLLARSLLSHLSSMDQLNGFRDEANRGSVPGGTDLQIHQHVQINSHRRNVMHLRQILPVGSIKLSRDDSRQVPSKENLL